MSARDEFRKQFAVEANAHSKIKKIIAVVSGKGGVGKSFITGVLASSMQKKGYQCAVLDADVTGASIPHLFGLNGILYAGDDGIIPAVTRTGVEVISSNLLLDDPNKPIIWRSPMINSIIKQFYSEAAWGEVDYMSIDMPPGTGDVPLTVFQSFPVDGVIIVTTPQDLVSMIVEKAVSMADQMEVPVLAVVENMSYVVCDDCGKKIELFPNKDHLIRNANVDTIVKLPLDPKNAAACDDGNVEAVVLPELNGLIEKIRNL